jgi:D-alanyl-D-alanine carboxypeptidase/D-alanyl-D-alanine-endopeptidase (penicillin-binding protein 4)
VKIRGFLAHIKLLAAAAGALTLILNLGLAEPSAAETQIQKKKTQANATGKKTTKKSSPKTGAALKKTSKSGKSAKKRPAAKRADQALSLPWPQNLQALVGDGAVLVVDHHAPKGQPRELYAYNAEKAYVPASIIKIVTSGAALEFFGPDYRFKTDFLLTADKDLWVVGYGDPYLVSEELAQAVKGLQKKGLKEVRHLYLDGSYFQKGLVLDGNTQTRNPYDAYNGAVSVNFNTINFARDKKGTVLRSSPHIPLTPLAREMGASFKRRGSFCLNISESPEMAELHAGQTIRAHLEEAGVKVRGEIIAGQTAPKRLQVFYSHVSSKNMEDNIRSLLEHSNNFMTNQIFLALGAELYGAPATLEKSRLAMAEYFKRHSLSPIFMGDGSGLSRQTTLTARQMAAVLEIVEPERHLFRNCDDGQVLCKTGTMSDIKTLAGYIQRPGDPDRPISFVVLLNGTSYPAKIRNDVLSILKAEFAPPLRPASSAGGR